MNKAMSQLKFIRVSKIRDVTVEALKKNPSLYDCLGVMCRARFLPFKFVPQPTVAIM